MPATSLPAAATDTGASKWWIALNGESRGPYTEAYVRTMLETRQLPGETLLCPVSGCEWKPATQWPVFHRGGSTSAIPPPPLEPRPQSDPVGTMLRVIGIYATFVAPTLFVLSTVALLTGDSEASRLHADSSIIGHAVGLEIFEFLIGLVAIICLVIGGWRLLKKSEAGLYWTIGVLGISNAVWFFLIPAQIVWSALVELHAPESASQPTAAWQAVVSLFNFAAFLFEVITLIWLVLNRQLLADRLRNAA